jgi:hypothetical protein
MVRHLRDVAMHGFDPKLARPLLVAAGGVPDVTGHIWRLPRGQRLFLEGRFRLEKRAAKRLAPRPFSNLMSLDQHLAQVRPRIPDFPKCHGSLPYHKLIKHKPPHLGMRLCEKIGHCSGQAQRKSNWPQGSLFIEVTFEEILLG